MFAYVHVWYVIFDFLFFPIFCFFFCFFCDTHYFSFSLCNGVCIQLYVKKKRKQEERLLCLCLRLHLHICVSVSLSLSSSPWLSSSLASRLESSRKPSACSTKTEMVIISLHLTPVFSFFCLSLSAFSLFESLHPSFRLSYAYSSFSGTERDRERERDPRVSQSINTTLTYYKLRPLPYPFISCKGRETCILSVYLSVSQILPNPSYFSGMDVKHPLLLMQMFPMENVSLFSPSSLFHVSILCKNLSVLFFRF